MAEYELVYEIKNLCRNNQMRDVFFEDVECDDPEEYLRGRSTCSRRCDKNIHLQPSDK